MSRRIANYNNRNTGPGSDSNLLHAKTCAIFETRASVLGKFERFSSNWQRRNKKPQQTQGGEKQQWLSNFASFSCPTVTAKWLLFLSFKKSSFILIRNILGDNEV